jgi:hypothetical protein
MTEGELAIYSADGVRGDPACIERGIWGGVHCEFGPSSQRSEMSSSWGWMSCELKTQR